MTMSCRAKFGRAALFPINYSRVENNTRQRYCSGPCHPLHTKLRMSYGHLRNFTGGITIFEKNSPNSLECLQIL